MKRLHIHMGVQQLDEAIGFYNRLFGAEPVKRKPDYAKWLLDDPPVNFAISTRVSTTGVDHMGIQVEKEQELHDIRQRFTAANLPIVEEGETLCCYAKSDKSWLVDPAGIPWEAYRTMEEAELFSGPADADKGACCTPSPADESGCCNATEETLACCS